MQDSMCVETGLKCEHVHEALSVLTCSH